MDISITDKDFERIKNKVRAEMKRRSATEHGASLFVFGGAEWEFEVDPETGCIVIDEYVRKIIDPLLQVNDFLDDNSLRKGKSGLEIPIAKMEEFIDKISKIPEEASNSGCRGSCTGLCAEACTSGCIGCQSCRGGCSTTCNKACSSSCGGGCSGCSSGCYNGCTHTCGSGCQTSLRY